MNLKIKFNSQLDFLKSKDTSQVISWIKSNNSEFISNN